MRDGERVAVEGKDRRRPRRPIVVGMTDNDVEILRHEGP